MKIEVDLPSPTRTYLTAGAWCEPELGAAPRWVDQAWFRVDAQGTIVAIGSAAPALVPLGATDILHDLGHVAVLPGLVNGHSHAFQRLIRGRTGRRGEGDPSSFWSWRTAMYHEAASLDPDHLFAATRACYAEMAQAGISCVGEFHYLHHQADGTPYADPNELSKVMVAAAHEVGIRLVLLDVYYARAGFGQELLSEQRRFRDASVEVYLRRIDDLRTWLGTSDARLGLAPHSVRAVDAPALAALADYASRYDLVVHSHVSEQVRENEECMREHQRTPLGVFADSGLLARPHSFTAVHAIHVSAADEALLAAQHVCACPTTEADLGDGTIMGSRWLAAGARLSLGSDSNSVIDLVQEARLLEMHERLASRARLVLADTNGEVVPRLIEAATRAGASSLGRAELGRLAVGSPFDAALFDLDHVSLQDVAVAHSLDALFLAGSAAPCIQTFVGGRMLPRGRHRLQTSRDSGSDSAREFAKRGHPS